ncbi:hypothetical protein ARMGADRAFT_1022973 [Armillaria gallica]|uniref:Uncharacterized protein n=1 Tax=Armillaria gallica TaxID=47427 RepID=A0A2H3F218_ARMGA|nr:hypothetical protein ARMGADRAFT_1022973 [Armillaria gallica]
MTKLNIHSTECFPQWLAEELAYLKSWAQDPLQETLEMEYYSQLVAFYHTEDNIQKMRGIWMNHNSTNINEQDNIARIETVWCQLFEKQDKALEHIRHRHIRKALKAQYQIIQDLLDQYNAMAKALVPPQEVLKWEDIIKYMMPGRTFVKSHGQAVLFMKPATHTTGSNVLKKKLTTLILKSAK